MGCSEKRALLVRGKGATMAGEPELGWFMPACTCSILSSSVTPMDYSLPDSSVHITCRTPSKGHQFILWGCAPPPK